MMSTILVYGVRAGNVLERVVVFRSKVSQLGGRVAFVHAGFMSRSQSGTYKGFERGDFLAFRPLIYVDAVPV